jgi:hypothetical protein
LHEASAPAATDSAAAPVEGEKGFLEKLVAKVIDNAQLFITGALIRFEDYSHADTPYAFELAFDSLWIHPEHMSALQPGNGGGGGGGGGQQPRQPNGALTHREVLVCALCAYSLDATSLPAAPQLVPCASISALEERLRSSGVPLDAPVALRSNARRCCLAPLSFAAELASRRLNEPSLPQQVLCLETGRIHLDLSAAELLWLAATLSYAQRFEALERHRSFRPPRGQPARAR